uniref:Aminotransferase-like plant mobile domain-containing protein n=1 Tax=Fagus sylvatica TaxID=28930 RepID=A0A2N9J7Y3_FAGSY
MNRSSDEGVMAPGSRGVGAVFVHFSGEDSGQTGDAIGEPRVPRRSWSRYLSNAPGLADQLVASRKDSAREGGSCAAYFCKVPDLRKSELGLVRYGPANRGHRGVFGPFEGSFPIGIPASPDKFLAIREFLVVHECVLLSNVPGLVDQLVASQEDSARKRGNVGGKIPELSAKPYFVGLFSRAWPCTEASLGSQDMILANGGRRNVPYAKGFDHNSLVSRPFSARKVSNRSSHHVLQQWSRERFVSVCVSVPSGVQMDIPRVENDRTRCGEVVRGSKGPFGVEVGTPIDDQFSPTRPTAANRVVSTVWNLSPNRLRSDLTWGLPKLQIGWFNGLESQSKQMSDRGSGSGGHRRSDRLAKGKAAELDAEAAGLAPSTVRPPSRPGITIGRSARPSSAPRQPTAAPPAAPPARSKRRRYDRAPLSADPIPEDYVAPGFRYPPQGGIRPRYPVTTPVVDTSLLTCLHDHPSSSVRRCEDPPESIGRGGWSEFCQLLEIARPEYRDFLAELGFGPFLSIRYVHVRHPLVRCWVERIPPSDPVSDFEALEILGIDDPAAIVGKKLFYLKISYLRDLLVREMEEPPTELRYRQWTAYFIFSCFLVFPLARRFPRDSAWIPEIDRPWSCLVCGYGSDLRGPRELLMGERTLRQLGGEALVPVDPPQLMTIEDYIPRAPESRVVRVMGGSAMDSHLFQSSGEFERLQTEILRLQLELSVSEDRYAADMDRAQEQTVPLADGADAGAGGADPGAGGLDPESEGLGFSRCGADCSCLGQTSSSPPPDPVSRDWFFDDPPSL